MITIYIDGLPLEVPEGENLIEAVKRLGKEIPHYCYHPKLAVVGNCRMCLVELGNVVKDAATGEVLKDADGRDKVQWMPRLGIACGTKVAQGLHVRTCSELVRSAQQGVMEFLLINHPLDCPICDKAGECRLQEFAVDYGQGYSRFVEEKNHKPKRVPLGPRVILDDERCILCSRCVRFCEDILHEKVLGFTQHGSHTTLSCFPGKQLDSNYSLNTVDICPVGALTSTDFRFNMRVWFLKKTKSICTESSVGVNTHVWSREGVIYRITPRRNDAVNSTWMSDSGRMLYKGKPDRLTACTLEGKTLSFAEALEKAKAYIKDGKLGYVVSGHASVEELYLLKLLVEKNPGPVFLVPHTQPGDGFLISEDATPNRLGAVIVGLVESLDTPPLPLEQALANGTVTTLFCLGEAPLKNNVRCLYLGTQKQADPQILQLAGLTVFEKDGSFINKDARLQAFEKAIPGPAGIASDHETLRALLDEAPLPMNRLRTQIAQKIPTLVGIVAIPENGVVVEGTKGTLSP